MRYRRLAAALAAALTACAACAICAPARDRAEELLEAAGRREAERPRAEALRAALDAGVTREPLERLWARAVSGPSDERLQAAWSVLRVWCPEGDAARWAEVNYLETPSLRPRALMVIDALYAAIIGLRVTPGGVWVAADLLREFARSSHGRYDFLGVCPAPVAEAVEYVASRAGMIGLWTPREVTGRLPVAVCVRGTVSENYARMEGMQFLDGAGLPANSGLYAWDRRRGRIYRVALRLFRRD